MKRCLILVEGQTEESVVKHVLRPHFEATLALIPTLVVTKRVASGPNHKGGVQHYGQLEWDLRRLLRDTNVAVVTTLLDYYALPSDVPGMRDRPPASPLERVEHVERAFADAIEDPRFVPVLALHELEAWLFSDLEASAEWYPPDSDFEPLHAARAAVETPEFINESYDTAPSRRILAACPGYKKTLHGPLAIEAIGLAKIRAECPHADAWLRQLEAIAA